MTEEQQDAVYAAYLGICVLQRMCRAARLQLAETRAKELLVEMGTAFPFLAERVAKSALRVNSSEQAIYAGRPFCSLPAAADRSEAP